MCTGHALIRIYESGAWYLACAYPECAHRIPEGGAVAPSARDLELPTDPEEAETTA